MEPLGDTIISWSMYIFIASWGLGWVLLLLIMLIQKCFLNLKQKSEGILKSIERLIGLIMKYSLIAAGVLLLIQLIAFLLGWYNPYRALGDGVKMTK